LLWDALGTSPFTPLLKGGNTIYGQALNFMEILFSLFPSEGSFSDPYLWMIMVASIFCGAFITSGFGVGGAVLTTPLFIMILPPKFAIGLLAPLNLFMSLAGARLYWKKWNRRHLAILLPAGLTGIFVGSYLLAAIPVPYVVKTVGVLAFVFGIFQFLTLDRPEIRDRFRPNDWQGVGLGFASGITSALAHIGGIVFSFYLLPHSKDKEAFVGTTVVLFATMALLKIGTYSYYLLLTPSMLFLSLFLLPPSFLGAFAGKWLNRRLPNRLFTHIIALIITLMGLKLLLF
jgi:uncharacterized protein